MFIQEWVLWAVGAWLVWLLWHESYLVKRLAKVISELEAEKRRVKK